MTGEIIIACIGFITTTAGSWLSWFLTRKKYNTEVDNNVIENMKQSLDFYMRLSDDNKNRLDEALKRNDALEDEVRELRKQVYELMANLCYDLQCQQRVRTGKKTTRYSPNSASRKDSNEENK